MAVNKIIYNGETLVDLTSNTVTADDLAAGVTATGADGKPVIGLLPKVTIDTELSTTSTNPVQNKTITAALSNLDIDIATNDEIDNALNLAGSGDLPTGGGVSSGSNYTLPTASSSTLGGVKIGSNISVSDGTISLAKSNVTSALGYTPPASDTTYGDATTTSSGLMSSTDKVKLNGIADNANYYIHPPTHPASMISGLATVATSGNYNDLANKPGNATTSAAGLMSAADKAKLDKVDADAGSVKLITYS